MIKTVLLHPVTNKLHICFATRDSTIGQLITYTEQPVSESQVTKQTSRQVKTPFFPGPIVKDLRRIVPCGKTNRDCSQSVSKSTVPLGIDRPSYSRSSIGCGSNPSYSTDKYITAKRCIYQIRDDRVWVSDVTSHQILDARQYQTLSCCFHDVFHHVYYPPTIARIRSVAHHFRSPNIE